MKKYPKIISVKALDEKKLELFFEGNIKKIYDCTPLLTNEIFKPLQNKAFFQNVHIDTGGYGISWNDYIDLAESELWENGII
jgi:Protein of unknown function (DUF2442)